MTRRCLCWAYEGCAHAFACPYPEYERARAVVLRWNIERDRRRVLAFKPDYEAQAALQVLAEQMTEAPR